MKQQVTDSRTEKEMPVHLRRMELSDMDGLMKLKNAEGWNQLEKDWALLISYKESVNLVAVLDKRIVGSVTALNYNKKVAWIGMMLVDKDYRGRGIGKQLMLAVMAKLKGCESIKLDATPAGRPLYLKLGFKDEYTLYRVTHPSVSRIPLHDGQMEAEKIQGDDLPEVAAFDKEVFGADRTELITGLYESYPELAWLIRENNRLAGFCLGRPGQNFTQIGPVDSASDKHATALIRSAVNQITGHPVVLDIPANKSDTMHWLEAYGFKAQRPFERMYLKVNPHPGRTDNVYLIAGPELG
jgi:GNAT superfamily N-acetyltransferase